MTTFRNRLIRLGNTHPELREELRPVIATLDKQTSAKPVLTPYSAPQSVFHFDTDEDPDDADALFDFYRLLDRVTKGLGKRVGPKYDYAVIYEVWTNDLSEFLGALMVGEDGVYVFAGPSLKSPKVFKHRAGIIENPEDIYPLLEEGSKYLVKVIEANKQFIRERQSAEMEIEHLKSAIRTWAKNRNDGRWNSDLYIKSPKRFEGWFLHPAIPKDTFGMDHWDIERYLDQDRQALEKALRPYRHLVKDFQLYLGDKNTVDFHVNLK